MPDIYNSFTQQETTSKKLDEYRVVNFAYDDTAFNKPNEPAGDGAIGKDNYDYNAHNNIENSPKLPDDVLHGGFNRISGVFKRSFLNHYLGRISYNLNKTIQALGVILGSFKNDYSENISEYSTYAVYNTGDVCFRIDGNNITFYRCKANNVSGTFNGVYWEKPEEEQTYTRPAVGVPVPWFEKVPTAWAIRFDDGSHHYWKDCPALNFTEFRNLVTVDANDVGFTVPNYLNKVPMFTGGSNSVKSGYAGNVYTACVGPHTHSAPALTFSVPAETYSHTHDSVSSSTDGEHKHNILNKCKYDGHKNTSMLPVDPIDRYNPATLTEYDGSHSHSGINTSDNGVNSHAHTVTVTGYTGGIRETSGGNPDSFYNCWIVRYK